MIKGLFNLIGLFFKLVLTTLNTGLKLLANAIKNSFKMYGQGQRERRDFDAFKKRAVARQDRELY